MIDDSTTLDEIPYPLNVDTERLRELCLEWIETRDFMDHFWDMHPRIIFRSLVAVIGIFNSEIRGYSRKRGKSSPELMARYRKAVRSAPLIFSRVVMANTALLYDGTSSPALVVVSSGEDSDDVMDRASAVLSRVHFGGATTPEEEALAITIEDEDYHFGKRRLLPQWLVGDVEAYAADLWVPGTAAYPEGLRSNLLPCFAEPGIDGLTFAIPTAFVEASIRRKTPPPIPQRTSLA
ncbi:MAG: hypothetical protein P1U85_21550 [Verrucomicrobiales bacterium]|jgi:hypothetical protein|nr:hypothetical protein [Verrucomicrobiales bacterium]